METLIQIDYFLKAKEATLKYSKFSLQGLEFRCFFIIKFYFRNFSYNEVKKNSMFKTAKKKFSYLKA